MEALRGGLFYSQAGTLVLHYSQPRAAVSHTTKTGAIPQNVNYAVKSAFVLPFVENIPEIKQAAKTAYKDRAEIIEQVKKATVLVICY